LIASNIQYHIHRVISISRVFRRFIPAATAYAEGPHFLISRNRGWCDSLISHSGTQDHSVNLGWLVSRNKHMIRFTLRAGRPQFSENRFPSVPHSSSHNRSCLVSGQLNLPALRREIHALQFIASSLILPTGTPTPSRWFICGSPPQAVRCGTGFGQIPIASGRRRSAQLLRA
jgi:hypothetical protein